MNSPTLWPQSLSIDGLVKGAEHKYPSAGRKPSTVKNKRNRWTLRMIRKLFAEERSANAELDNPRKVLFSQTHPEFALKADEENEFYTLYSLSEKTKVDITTQRYFYGQHKSPKRETHMSISPLKKDERRQLYVLAQEDNYLDVINHTLDTDNYPQTISTLKFSSPNY